jgi:cyanate permease
MFIHINLLPVYFEAIRGSTPLHAGIQMLPAMISMMITSLLTGVIISKGIRAGYVMLFTGLTVTIASGLFYTISALTPSDRLIGYLVFLGFGYGGCLQLGLIVAQKSAKPADMAQVTAAVNCILSSKANVNEQFPSSMELQSLTW